MGLGEFISRIDRLAGRFNGWIGGTAVATGVERSGSGGPVIDAAAVVAVLGELERECRPDDEDKSPSGKAQRLR